VAHEGRGGRDEHQHHGYLDDHDDAVEARGFFDADDQDRRDGQHDAHGWQVDDSAGAL